MNERIRLLDCTLRDGGHLNSSAFGKKVIKNVIQQLIESKMDIIEVGFLWGERNSEDIARYYNIEDVKRILPKEKGISKYSLMADSVNLENLEQHDGTIDFIRLSFKPQKTEWAFSTAEILKEKGYQLFINPIYCNTYSDQEYLEMIQRVNELHPYGFSIVDTFGTMRKRDLDRRVNLVDYHLDPEIVLGLHLHENLGLANCLAQHFLSIVNPKRNVIIDCSLFGMGRAPGNLCTEQIMDYLNIEFGKSYNTEPVLDAIDDYIAPLKGKTTWGYSIPYYISAKYSLPRSYAEYLLGKSRLKTRDIQRILKSIPIEKTLLYDENYIEKLYRQYMGVHYDSSEALYKMEQECKGRKVLIISPGTSISYNKKIVSEYIENNNPIVFAVNFIPANLKVDSIFCTNTKRYKNIIDNKKNETLFITSNLLDESKEKYFVISYNDVVYNSELFCDDSTVMLLNALQKCNIKSVTIAGFDGFINGYYGFYDKEFEPRRKNYMSDKEINYILKHSFDDMQIRFLTSSAHENYYL